tara:strand:- start:430 stop:873 length:444 start_codon:yes stop_codon:yes gene_type:complete
MVQKHEMTADFEQLSYSSEMLMNAWDGVSETYEELRYSNFASNELYEFVNWIRKTTLSQLLFPGISLGQLLISKSDEHGRLNYQKTLKIGLNQQTGNYDFSYSDWDLIREGSDWGKAIVWAKSCQTDQLRNCFEEFLAWKPEWDNRC